MGLNDAKIRRNELKLGTVDFCNFQFKHVLSFHF